jgi:hypothetical protein
MNCFECAKVNDAVPAVGMCHHCGVGLCMDHLVEAREHRVGGALYGCEHTMPCVKRLTAMSVSAPTARKPTGVA